MASKSVGFISVPAWFDPAPDEFRELTRGEIGVQQTFLGAPDFDYRVGSIAAAEPLLVEAAQQLAAAGCSIIANPATPLGYIGHRDIAGARASLAVIERACGVECVFLDRGDNGNAGSLAGKQGCPRLHLLPG